MKRPTFSRRNFLMTNGATAALGGLWATTAFTHNANAATADDATNLPILETSDLASNRMEIEPRCLLCMNCMRGNGNSQCIDRYKIAEQYQEIDKNPEMHLTLIGAFDNAGARTERFYRQSPAERLKDLNVLQRLGLNFGDTRSARDLFTRLSLAVKNLDGICRYPDNPYGKWHECELSDGSCYIRGNKPLRNAQNPDEMAAQKISSCQKIAQADKVVIRPHHLLCVLCFAGRPNNHLPLKEDNLYEAWMRFRENPDVLVALVEGPGECCICPPCHAYVPSRGLCVASCHLRDRKKDLDTCVALGVSPGDTLTARELYKRIGERIPTASVVCAYETDTSLEWTTCGGAKSDSYEQGLALTLEYLK